jgi:COP9 signalosome complex subunit 12
MDAVLNDFKVAYGSGDGYALSMTLSPLDPPSQPSRLSSFFRSTNAASAIKDFKYRILYDNSTPFKLSQEEGNGWVDVYFAYWKAIGEILGVENATKANEKVSSLGVRLSSRGGGRELSPYCSLGASGDGEISLVLT